MTSGKDTPKRAVMTVKETAEVLGIGLNQAYEGIRSGQIPSLRIGKRIIVPRIAFEKKLEGSA
jgi:excisionase family DNA binding protein